MIVSLIVSVADNGVIGKDGGLAVRLSADLQRFKRLTMGHPIIMGRKTYETDVKRVLPGRTNIIVTHDMAYQVEGAVIVHSLKEALDQARAEDADEAFIIGGGMLFKEALPRADQIYLTQAHARPEGDTFFHYEAGDWQVVEHEESQADEKNPISSTYLLLARKTKY
jgi:dihydrofolate reductase